MSDTFMIQKKGNDEDNRDHYRKETLDKRKHSIPYNKKVNLRINYGEVHLGCLVKAVGEYWNKEKMYWELPYR